jgi:NADH-quinone oxidoreductase subunit M
MIIGLFKKTIWFALAGGSAMVLGAIYMLYAFQKVMLGNLNPVLEKVSDIRLLDYFILVPLIILILGLGLFPQPVLDLVRDTVNSVPYLMNPSNLTGPGI